MIEATFIQPTLSGHILPQTVNKEIKQNTCLICIMSANNETGAINNIKEICQIARKKNILFHCDVVQSFGKMPFVISGDPLNECPVDSFSVSFHKIYGPPGIGILVIRATMLRFLQPMIYGSQNSSFRGGTENLIGIGASFVALRSTLTDRVTKNSKLQTILNYLMENLAKIAPVRTYEEYVLDGNSKPLEIILLSRCKNPQFGYLPNTLLFSVVKRTEPVLCNTRLKKELEKRNIIVSIGSACNTSSPKASHVLYALKADEFIRKGTLRISLGDLNTLDEAKKFIEVFATVLKGEISCH
jgi:cysteine desulfurase